MKDMFNLKGKTALITGGSRGIGKGIARGLASEGMVNPDIEPDFYRGLRFTKNWAYDIP